MKSPDWSAKYVGMKFLECGRDASGVDCWGLVCLVLRAERGIELPDYLDVYKSIALERSQIATEIMRPRQEWQRVATQDAQPFDVLVVRMHGLPMHVGVVVEPGRFLHILKGGVDSTVERYDSIVWRNRIEGVYRHAAA